MFIPIIAEDTDWLINIKVDEFTDEGGTLVVIRVLEVGGTSESVASGGSEEKKTKNNTQLHCYVKSRIH